MAMSATRGPERRVLHHQPGKLPLEVIAEIIATVADGTDFDSADPDRDPDVHHPLADASLVSRTWNTICRPHVFHTLSISSTNTSARLHFLHFDAPYLSDHIRTVRLWLEGEYACPDSEWYPACFGRLTNLRALHVDHGIASLLKEQELLAAGISAMLAAPCLRKLVLRGWDFSTGASDLFAMLPPTLEDLMLELISATTEGDTAQPTSPLRLYALRHLELQAVFHPMLTSTRLIDCPNLQRLTAGWYAYQSWNLPPWIPDTLSELVLRAAPECNIPDFGTAIKPSAVTIEPSGEMSYLEVFVWIQDCINHLPFPGCIQTLTLNIFKQQSASDDDCEGLFPTPSEYEVLCSFLVRLYEGGGVRRITLNMTAAVHASAAELRVDAGREAAKVETAFAMLLEGNVLDVCCMSASCHVEDTIVHCRIPRRESVKSM
ncbi:hypothetical protein PC9H_005668 [Pleurotus ostreatus]|uniref:F-box domain-containing protein n=1 Tax=Pleurotus ostreatus TaxID=5322 RepID=A0A8H7DVQ9_PLEOS|nr:uncharacterized protein PC9H_005668 [Pleurotus ostreatus]KAF7433705.1 hypothetical protein PC9H_005668 [Pleurotus ostreatus]KAJ8697534.1 hypothetical protein PTI98_004327 [Pleurotus ostreatus]